MNERKNGTSIARSAETKESIQKFILDALLVVTAFAWTDAFRSLWTGPRAPFKFLAERGPWVLAAILTVVSLVAMRKFGDSEN